jgi:hypothetical protein
VALRDPDVHSVLEFGPGRGSTKALLEHYGIAYQSVDIADDHDVADAVRSLDDGQDMGTFDLVCAFQVLEHGPVDELAARLRILASHARRYVYVSLPFNGRWLSVALNVNLPFLALRTHRTWTGERWRPARRPVEQFAASPEPWRPHWWEVGDRNARRRAVRETIAAAGLRLVHEHHNPMFPYHLFYLMEVSAPAGPAPTP